MPRTYLHLLTAVTALGSTATDVADLLDAGGWRGAPNRSSACPIARYLTDVVPDATGACVSEADISIWIGDDYVETATPTAIADFIDASDGGGYAHLVDPLTADDPDDL